MHIFFNATSVDPDFSWSGNEQNIRLSLEQCTGEAYPHDLNEGLSTTTFDFALKCLSAASTEGQAVASLIIPRRRGWIARSDIVPLRLLDCSLARHVISLAKPLQFFDGETASLGASLEFPQIFTAAAGAILLRRPDLAGNETYESLLQALDEEVGKRLSFPWLSAHELRRQTIAIVCGGVRGPDAGMGRSMYTAAEALGIDMVVVDDEKHWANDPRYRHWYKAFLPLKLPIPVYEGFVDDLVTTLQSFSGHIDGIVTFRERYRVAVAEVALRLGLSTEHPWAYATSIDKFKTSVSAGHRAFEASTVEQASSIIREHNLSFPLIIKPSTGYLSEGVSKIDDITQLEAGVTAINADRHGRSFVIEKYCDGPEVDANLALCDGKLEFFEASDDFPKSADKDGQSAANNFLELANVLPSGLPQHESAVLQHSLHQDLLRMGFRSGFFHLEARVENSSMEYASKDGLLDLRQRPAPSEEAPSAWLIEVNPRPPGVQALTAVKHTYGVEYTGVGLLYAVNDHARIRQLLHPFRGGAQYWCEMVFIPVEKGGIYQSGDVCEELRERRPDLAAHFSEYKCFLEHGARVADPTTGVHSWVAYFNVFSRESRIHLLKLADCVRKEVRFSIV